MQSAYSLRLMVVLIHEVAHAASSVHHGGIWEARMAKAADQAEHLGRIELASRIRSEILGYATCSWTPTASAVYQQISDAAWDCPRATFGQVVDLIRRDCGLTREGFLRRFRRAAVVYEEAQAEAEEHAKAKAAMKNEK